MIRRRNLMEEASGGEEVTVPITWSGAADKTSSIVDATGGAVYFTLPFVEGDTRMAAGATAESYCGAWRRAALYSDAECTQLVGYYDSVNDAITSERPTAVNSPWFYFDTEMKMAPKGYYVRLMLTRRGTAAAFTANDKFGAYLDDYGNFVTLKS